ncbi:MAG: hypothetical protein J6N54_08915 [Bacteroidales bacterium]|nr:hypothetical protein [Bacteroidales bacterium]
MSSKREIGREMLDNMTLTKEQYANACALIDELSMEKGPLKCELPVEDEWASIDSMFTGHVV